MSDWYDLDSEERAAWTERAEEASGQSWYDLDPDERAAWRERAEEQS
jgi:hypothetical protein